MEFTVDASTDEIPRSNTPAVGVIGSGYWGRNLVRNYYELGALRVVCDKNDSLLADFKKQYGDVEYCLAINDVLRREDIDGIVVSTPAETHFSIVREGLLAGKHIYVEKPLVLREKEAEELIELAEKNNRVLMVGHLLQYHPAFVKLKELAKAGELGRINYIYSNRLNLGKIRREENILWSFAPHDISMILSLVGEEPERVLATGGNYLHRKIADVTTTHMDFPSGLKAHIFVSWLHPFKEQKLVVVGDRKMAVFDDTHPWEDKLLLYPHEIRWKEYAPVASKANPERVEIDRKEPLRIECEHFLHCISTGSRPLTDGKEGLRVLRVLNAGQRSLDGFTGWKTFDKVRRFEGERKKQYFVHPTAVLDEEVTIGQDTKIWHFSHILSGSRIGRGCNLGQNVVIGPEATVGDHCKIQNNVSVYKGVTLEEGVFCGPSMVFTNVINPRAEIRKMDQILPTLVMKGATIGANATVVCGVTIGRFAFVGAGAVVTRNIPDHALFIGNPAKQRGWICCCGETLGEDFECRECSKRFELTGDGLREIVPLSDTGRTLQVV
jgi:UDP-2-acetamido-3-amino-2,3-dideoxy-glucuronate N-acetyltransferase